MRILAVSDEECEALWDYYQPGRLDNYDLILSCGDLKAAYLTFLVTMGNKPLLYVPGNHDKGYLQKPPDGCVDIDCGLVTFNGYRILGLGGCLRYNPGPYQYTEEQMYRRLNKLRFALWRAGGVDIVITHAPPKGVGDREDPAHRGFETFLELIDKYSPTYLLHGHVHARYDIQAPRERRYRTTQVINVSERYVLELPDRPVEAKDKNQVKWLCRHKEPPDDEEVRQRMFNRF